MNKERKRIEYQSPWYILAREFQIKESPLETVCYNMRTRVVNSHQGVRTLFIIQCGYERGRPWLR